jgi:prohibitin 1
MASQFLNRIGQLGLGIAVVGGVVNSALYNGKLSTRKRVKIK